MRYFKKYQPERSRIGGLNPPRQAARRVNDTVICESYHINTFALNTSTSCFVRKLISSANYALH